MDSKFVVGVDENFQYFSSCLIIGLKSQIKIEVNTITRGHLHPGSSMPVLESERKEFKKFAEMNIVSVAEIDGGKICAVMDRQHPRDIFDVKLLMFPGIVRNTSTISINYALMHLDWRGRGQEVQQW